ncbi:MAG: hypothetical protein QOC81_3998 [Thermoanaerobaculia bacterium]|jgi:SAM-dependent methyltransferase|nr:hypothetical protein [Thermoanaerobaculia bacterium]
MATTSPASVGDEFDRLSELPDSWDFNEHEHRHLLRLLPNRIVTLLDAGCGAGAFARAVAPRCDHVVGIDLSPGMIARARSHPGTPSNIEYSVSDLFAAPFAPASFDAIVSIAAVHHMDMKAAFLRFASLLRPGGTLLVVDLLSPGSLLDRLASLGAYALAPSVRFWNTGRIVQPRAVRAAWADHEKHDSFTTLRDVRALAATVLPGSRVQRRLFWRYCLIWRAETKIRDKRQEIRDQRSRQTSLSDL